MYNKPLIETDIIFLTTIKEWKFENLNQICRISWLHIQKCKNSFTKLILMWIINNNFQIIKLPKIEELNISIWKRSVNVNLKDAKDSIDNMILLFNKLWLWQK